MTNTCFIPLEDIICYWRIQGVRRCRPAPPQQDLIVSFLHTFHQKCLHQMSAPPPMGLEHRSQTGNPGSAPVCHNESSANYWFRILSRIKLIDQKKKKKIEKYEQNKQQTAENLLHFTKLFSSKYNSKLILRFFLKSKN